ncbi:MAG TPA: hypothetical protein VMG08_13485 [Allosphingosinicella sp.]|nr:hypothetical protein [Allosphingosinicella sp.]
MFARTLAAVAALSLAAASPAAAQSAASLSLAQLPAATGAELGDASDLRGGYTPFILGAIAIGILIFVVIELGDDNALPGSP